MIRHQRQIMVVLLPRNLIDSDIHQPRQPIRIQHIPRHPLADHPDRAPTDSSERADRRLVSFRNQPRHQLLEITREPRFRPRERYLLGEHPMLGATQPSPPHPDPAHPTTQIKMTPPGVYVPRVIPMRRRIRALRTHQQPPGQPNPHVYLTATGLYLPRPRIDRCHTRQTQQTVQ
jgi:hypothetical protein